MRAAATAAVARGPATPSAHTLSPPATRGPDCAGRRVPPAAGAALLAAAAQMVADGWWAPAGGWEAGDVGILRQSDIVYCVITDALTDALTSVGKPLYAALRRFVRAS